MKCIHRVICAALMVITMFNSATSPAYAHGDVPPDVEAWFRDVAVELISGLRPGRDLMPSESAALDRIAVGEPQPLHVMSLDAPIGASWVSSGEWVAALFLDTVVVGQVVAWRSPSTGEVALAYFDDRASAGQGAVTAAANPHLLLVTDPLGSGLLLIDTQRDVVTPVEQPDRSPMSVPDYVGTVRKLVEEAEQAPSPGRAGGMPGVFPDGSQRTWLLRGAIGFGVISLVCGLVMMSRASRKKPVG